MDISGEEAFDKLLARIEDLATESRRARESARDLGGDLRSTQQRLEAMTKDRDRLAEALAARNDEIGRLRSQIAKYEGAEPDKPETPKHWPSPADISF
jgi:predicted nuclease with TOPRIM domain